MTQNCINSADPIIQFVSATTSTSSNLTTAFPFDDTIPQNTEGDEMLTVTITPKFATSRLEIWFSTWISKTTTGSQGVALFQDSTADALTAKAWQITNGQNNFGYLHHIMTSGTTSSTTFKVRAGSAANSTYLLANSVGAAWYGASAFATFTVTEFI